MSGLAVVDTLDGRSTWATCATCAGRPVLPSEAGRAELTARGITWSRQPSTAARPSAMTWRFVR